MVNADDLETATACVTTALEPATGQDWPATAAGSLDWDCWHTAEHVGDCLLSYAAQLVAQPAGRYVRFLATADAQASAAEVLEFAMTGGSILAATVRTAAPQVRAYHPTGLADPAGFAGMGCIEMLLHGQDMAAGLGLSLDPPRELCDRVLARMFPAAHAQAGGDDPWRVLQWATGRADLPGRPRPARWAWQAAPPGE
jgi:hypothetical protein